MALVKVKPTSPGRRAVVQVVNPDLHKGKPFAGLIESQSKKAGRNHNGHVTVRHQGGGHKQAYRMVDFKRAKDGIPGKIERLEYDPNRTANIALVEPLIGLCHALVASGDGRGARAVAARTVAVAARSAPDVRAGAMACLASAEWLERGDRASARARAVAARAVLASSPYPSRDLARVDAWLAKHP